MPKYDFAVIHSITHYYFLIKISEKNHQVAPLEQGLSQVGP